MVTGIRDQSSPFLEQGKLDAENITDENERRFSAICEEITNKMRSLFEFLESGAPPPQTVSEKDLTEKSATEKCLEALASIFGYSTSKEICDTMNPQIGGSTRRQAKSVSMLLLRLSRHHHPLVQRDKTGKEVKYLITIEGIKRLMYYRTEREKTRAERMRARMHAETLSYLRGLFSEIIERSREAVSIIEQMWDQNTAILHEINPHTRAMSHIHSVYKNNITELLNTILMLQQAILDPSNEIKQFTALIKSTKSLLHLGKEEQTLLHNFRGTLPEAEFLKKELRARNLELQAIKAHTAKESASARQRFRVPSPALQKEILAKLRALRQGSTQIQVYNRTTQIQGYKPVGVL